MLFHTSEEGSQKSTEKSHFYSLNISTNTIHCYI